ncbi:hypothetical protein EIL92_02615 [Campylobacter jejuni]|uniref:helix-turn-helix domain-containing protein n=1 Tax=Campylobacter TaxID=194 RepID=UPI0010795997|nr:hypothetical protein [Campylobacter jejuni]EAK7750505.1 hypothetical protein [Campylobacter jejuni]EDP2685603.1 hypothetical protein [Campylobacter jejuni]
MLRIKIKLIRVIFSIGAYIYNLRNKGYAIETIRNKDTRNTFYILKSIPKIKKEGYDAKEKEIR